MEGQQQILDKLDTIIEVLIRIEEKLSPVKPTEAARATTDRKPTKGMLEFQRMIEFSEGMDRTHFLSAVRKGAAEMMEIRKAQPSAMFRFKLQCLPRIDEKISKTGAQFYKDLKSWSEKFIDAIEAEGEQTLQRAIGRLNARAGS